MRHVIGPHHDHGHMGPGPQRAIDLGVEVLGFCADDRVIAERHRASRHLGQGRGQDGPHGLARMPRAEAGGSGVAQDGQADRGAGA